MHWRQNIEKIPDQQLIAKKEVPVVGKMPWLKRGGSADYGGDDAPVSKTASGATRVIKLGPPVSGVNLAVPPLTLATSSQPAPPGEISVPVGMSAPPPGFSATPLPPVPAPPPRPRINRNPTSQSMDMNDMLAGAHRHKQSRIGEMPPIPVPVPELSIPLPCDMPPPRTGLPALPAPEGPNNQPTPDVPDEIPIPLPLLPPTAHDSLAQVGRRPPKVPTKEKAPTFGASSTSRGTIDHGAPTGFGAEGEDDGQDIWGSVWDKEVQNYFGRRKVRPSNSYGAEKPSDVSSPLFNESPETGEPVAAASVDGGSIQGLDVEGDFEVDADMDHDPSLSGSGEVEIQKQKSRFKCPQCKGRFSSVRKVNRHVNHIHVPIPCSVCGVAVLKNNMARHQKMHSNKGKTFQCLICKKTFMRKDNLRTHTLNHIK